MKYKISELAKLLGVSTNTVRRYEDMGYISAVRDEKSGYRYYNDDDIFSVMNAKMHVKYGISHEQISLMQSFSLEETIDAYKKRMDEMDKQIAYMTYLRHRLKDDYLLMNKAATYSDIYEKMSLTMYTVIYKDGEKLLQEPERLQKLGEFIYNSPEVLHTYIIPKESVDNGNFRVCCGWSVKEEHMDKYGMTENSYTQIYKGKPSVMGISEVPADIGRLANENPEYLKELRFGNYDFQVLRKSDFFSRFFKCHHIKKDSLILKYPFIFVGMFPSTYGIYIIEHEPIFKWLKEGDIYGGW